MSYGMAGAHCSILCESLTVRQRSAVEEPLDLHVGVTDRGQLALKLGRLHLHQVRLTLDLNDEPAAASVNTVRLRCLVFCHPHSSLSLPCS